MIAADSVVIADAFESHIPSDTVRDVDNVITDFKVGIGEYLFLCRTCRAGIFQLSYGELPFGKTLIFTQGNACKSRTDKLKTFCIKAADIRTSARNIFYFHKIGCCGNRYSAVTEQFYKIVYLNFVFTEDEYRCSCRDIAGNVFD